MGWKDSAEQSEINLDTPDGLKFVCVAARLLYLGLCIYMCFCFLCYFRQRGTAGMCTTHKFCSHFDGQKHTKTNRGFGSIWLTRLGPTVVDSVHPRSSSSSACDCSL